MYTPPDSSTEKEFVICSPRLEGAHGAGAGIDRADDSLLRDEPQPARPVGEHREELVVDGRHAAQVVVALELEPGAERAGRLAHHPDVAVRGRDHRAVEVVEVEVAAAGEVVERVGGAQAGAGGSGCSASRSSVCGSNITRRGPSTPTQMDTIRPCWSNVTDAHSAPWNVEMPLHVAAERAREGVRPGHVGVVVDVAAPVRRP